MAPRVSDSPALRLFPKGLLSAGLLLVASVLLTTTACKQEEPKLSDEELQAIEDARLAEEAKKAAEEAERRTEELPKFLETLAEIGARKDFDALAEVLPRGAEPAPILENMSELRADPEQSEVFFDGLTRLGDIEPTTEDGGSLKVYAINDAAGPDLATIFLLKWNPEGWSLFNFGYDRATQATLAAGRIAALPGQIQNLHRIGAAIARHVGSEGAYPSDIVSDDGTPLLSWRVRLLPLLGEQELYDRFDLKQAWDSDANRPLIDEIPSVYFTGMPDGETGMLSVTLGDTRLVGGATPQPTTALTDDPQKTIVVALSRGELPSWTEPTDASLAESGDEPLADLKLRKYPWPVLLADGTAVLIKSELQADTARSLVSYAGGEETSIADVRETLDLLMYPVSHPLSFLDPDPVLSLKFLAAAVQRYANETGRFPSDILDANGKPLLSWRVRLLPYLGGDELYQAFRLDEPWNSEHNRGLLTRVPPLLRSAPDTTTTRMLAVSGDGTAIGAGQPVRIFRVRDGVANALGLIFHPDAEPVPWAKPTDLPLADLTDVAPESNALFLTLDGRVVSLPGGASADELRQAFLISDGARIEADRFRVVPYPIFEVPTKTSEDETDTPTEPNASPETDATPDADSSPLPAPRPE